MKTSILSRFSLVLLIISLLAISFVPTHRAVAGISPSASLTLTEQSPTQLDLMYTGPDSQTPGLFMVTNTGPDTWTITVRLDLAPISFIDFSNGWIEPENAQFVNEVMHSTDVNSNQLFVHSDLSILLNTQVSPDNTAFLVGQDSGVPIFLTFHDVAASAEASQGVPDGGTTLSLLGLSAVALLGLVRITRVRPA